MKIAIITQECSYYDEGDKFLVVDDDGYYLWAKSLWQNSPEKADRVVKNYSHHNNLFNLLRENATVQTVAFSTLFNVDEII